MHDKAPCEPEGEMPLGALFKFIHLSAENHFNQVLQALNLTSSQMHILIYLDNCERNGKKVNIFIFPIQR